eukprot:927929-Prorocentrum_minimum.AAC.1
MLGTGAGGARGGARGEEVAARGIAKGETRAAHQVSASTPVTFEGRGLAHVEGLVLWLHLCHAGARSRR